MPTDNSCCITVYVYIHYDNVFHLYFNSIHLISMVSCWAYLYTRILPGIYTNAYNIHYDNQLYISSCIHMATHISSYISIYMYIHYSKCVNFIPAM